MLQKIKLLWTFTRLEAQSCLFPVLIFGALFLFKFVKVPYISTYDMMLIVCLLAQYILYRTGIESWDEVKVIGLFHLIGLALELFKVYMGSWSYPQEAWTKVGGVPLYSGFMYASVASYLCQSWRLMKLELHRYPHPALSMTLGIAIYLNFMTHHWLWDMRWWLTGILFILYFRTYVSFQLGETRLRMPLIASFFCIGFFIWIGENIATALGAWQYPNQREAWALVSFSKISSWFLLVIVSFIIVANLKHVKNRNHIKHSTSRNRKLSN
ncbi:DUF817 domain-containing protein [Paenibacillus sp. N1-5-1-14]|uniref:DUF817 domain-containing protein n=1 Tax=Paenibacillus radicibacter TaxID=2972488 RepID=UPI002158F50B|nr:DUF817 domain-containing protein [Paenibacillus radicibacter]MCR8644806.1 DUF817 domain-containing protein [Paenibacillus radicibacter]